MRCSSQEKVNPVLQVASMTGAWYVWSIMTDSYSYCCWLLLIIVIPVDYIVLLIIKFQIIIGVLYESWFLLSNLHHYQHCCSTRHWLTLQQTWWQLQDPGLDDVLYHSCSISVWACHGMSHISMEDSFRQVLGTVVAGFGFDAVAHIHFWSHCLNMFIDLELANLVVSENGPGWYTEDMCFFADLGTKKTMIKTLVFFGQNQSRSKAPGPRRRWWWVCWRFALRIHPPLCSGASPALGFHSESLGCGEIMKKWTVRHVSGIPTDPAINTGRSW